MIPTQRKTLNSISTLDVYHCFNDDHGNVISDYTLDFTIGYYPLPTVAKSYFIHPNRTTNDYIADFFNRLKTGELVRHTDSFFDPTTESYCFRYYDTKNSDQFIDFVVDRNYFNAYCEVYLADWESDTLAMRVLENEADDQFNRRLEDFKTHAELIVTIPAETPPIALTNFAQ